MDQNLKWDALETVLLSDNWATLKTTKLRITFSDGTSVDTWRETYDRGDGAVILPFDPERRHVLLGRQFRWPAAYRNDPAPFLIEAAAGLLDNASPDERIREEAQEELGLTLTDPKFLYELYSSPGSITEVLHYYVATYQASEAQTRLAGLREEAEEIEVLDMPLDQAMQMVRDGEIRDAKTVVLLQHVALNL
jgi:nudix-type nucleoside diphosphatase (YffH/AdpP family)